MDVVVCPSLRVGVAGLIVGIQLLWQMRDQDRRGAASRRAVVMIAVAVLFVPAAQAGNRLTEYLRFLHERPQYQRVVATVTTRASIGAARSDRELDYIVDTGPPVRVAFPSPGRSSDTWCGVVFDPSAEVMQAGKLHWSIRGRRVTSCRMIDQPYYICCLP